MRALPYRAVARIALDIDSTLHHYWDLLERIAQERYGVALPYAEQRDWGITALEREQLIACVEETHTDENIEARRALRGRGRGGAPLARGRPLDPRDQPPPRVLRAGHPPLAGGRWASPTTTCTARFDKITRCVELDIDLLVDDSPVNITRAREQGMLAATLIHPWNEELVERDGVIGATTGRAGAPSSDEAARATERLAPGEPHPA